MFAPGPLASDFAVAATVLLALSFVATSAMAASASSTMPHEARVRFGYFSMTLIVTHADPERPTPSPRTFANTSRPGASRPTLRT